MIRIVVCVDVDCNDPVNAYRIVRGFMGQHPDAIEGWESSDEWYYDDGEQIPEPVISAARLEVMGAEELERFATPSAADVADRIRRLEEENEKLKDSMSCSIAAREVRIDKTKGT